MAQDCINIITPILCYSYPCTNS